MNIFITGGTGFIGKPLVDALLAEGHRLTLLTRRQMPMGSGSQAVEFCRNLANYTNLDAFDAVINLAGEPIFNHAWTPAQKQRLLESRIKITTQLVNLMQAGRYPPHTFISGSATGYYGDLPPSANFYDELTACGRNFSAEICRQWEEAALAGQSGHIRVCLVRTGLVLAEQGGALQRMLPLYRANLAGKLGRGKQYWAWIALTDHIQAVLFLLKNANCHGAFNLVAPQPVTNAEFNRRLAKALNRHAFLAVPRFALKLALGERAQLLLDNQPLIPRRLLEAGFVFSQPQLDFARILAQ